MRCGSCCMNCLMSSLICKPAPSASLVFHRSKNIAKESSLMITMCLRKGKN